MLSISGDYCGKIAENAINSPEISEKVHRLNNAQEMPKIFEDVRKKLFKSYEISKKRYDLRKRNLQFHLGDSVWKKNNVKSDKENLINVKLYPKYIQSISLVL